MRFAVSIVVALLTLLAGILLSGAGHGWVTGSTGAFVLAPIAFFASRNALAPSPSPRIAWAVLVCGLATCAWVAIHTVMEGGEHFFPYFRINGVMGASVAVLAVLGWLAPSLWGLVRVRGRWHRTGMQAGATHLTGSKRTTPPR
ncbi:hypothetical protein LJR125_000205 [Pseudoxanthomonas sp. LjRoot125]|uniref:hypothetical protein n=1 Tax=Pseudoxanthomonas sp. LjRoot125 TaxID=3342258 RepID=UPI003E11A515